MPKLSDSNEESVIVRWLKGAGEPFARGEPLAEIETDKATVVYEAESDGVLASIVVAEGGAARPGQPIATLGDVARPAAAPPPRPRAEPAPARAASDFRGAIREALDEALAADERVVFFGEDVAVAGGVFAVTGGLYERYGAERVFDTPISELALAGAAFGSAVNGLRPVVEIMFGDFLPLVMDSVVNQMSKYRFLTGGEVSVPVVIRSVVGAGGRFGAIHSQMPASWFMGVPGIKIAAPAFPGRRQGAAARRDRRRQPRALLRAQAALRPRGRDRRRRRCRWARPTSCARAATSRSSPPCAACTNASPPPTHSPHRASTPRSIDLRTLRPLDTDTILASLAKTNRVVVVEEGPLTGGWAGELLALVTERGLGDLDDAWRITTPDSPIPYSPPLEDAHLPDAERIAAEIAGRLG